uniref:CYP4F12 n=1 Tax=Piliocolobus tephrosceles TaxID=591936 RepID=A0A8C9LPU5_9PRIM
MLQLSLSWLGLGPVTASPWLLLPLVGGSWLLARVLAWTYTFYNNCRRLQCFPQPPKQNWFWGHQGLVSLAAGRRTSTLSSASLFYLHHQRVE